jgi:hypothetical protein
MIVDLQALSLVYIPHMNAHNLHVPPSQDFFTLFSPNINSLNLAWYLQQQVFHCFNHLTNQGLSNWKEVN